MVHVVCADVPRVRAEFDIQGQFWGKSCQIFLVASLCLVEHQKREEEDQMRRIQLLLWKASSAGMKDFLSRARQTFFFATRGFSPQSESTATTTRSSASKVAALHKSRDTVAVSRRDACWLLFWLERVAVGKTNTTARLKFPHYYSVTLPQSIRTRLRGGATSSSVPPIGDSEASAAFRPVLQQTQDGGDGKKKRRNWEGEKKVITRL